MRLRELIRCCISTQDAIQEMSERIETKLYQIDMHILELGNIRGAQTE